MSTSVPRSLRVVAQNGAEVGYRPGLEARGLNLQADLSRSYVRLR